jgi:hypothetical protein
MTGYPNTAKPEPGKLPTSTPSVRPERTKHAYAQPNYSSQITPYAIRDPAAGRCEPLLASALRLVSGELRPQSKIPKKDEGQP